MKKEDYLLKEKPWKAILYLAFPLFIGNIFQQCYAIFDQMMVGHYIGELAQAAIGNASTLTNLFLCIAFGGSIGASVVVGRYFGAKSFSHMKSAMFTALCAFLLFGLFFGGIGFCFAKSFLTLLKTPAEAMNLATSYVRIYFLSLPFLFLYNMLAALFNALGKSTIPLYVLLFSSCINIGLDYLLMVQLKWGIAGAAWATFIAQSIAMMLLGIPFFHLVRLFPKAKAWLSWKEGKRMLKIALPSIFQQSSIAIGSLFVQSVINSFGVSIVAGVTIAMRIESICIVPFSSIGTALSSYTAQNIGAKRTKRIWQGWKTALLYLLACSIFLCLLLEIAYFPLVFLFNQKAESLALKTGIRYIRWIGWFFLLLGFKMATDGILRGAGNMFMFMLANLSNLTLRVVLTLVLAPRYGIEIVWIVIPLGWLINDIISYFAYCKMKKSFSK